MKHLLLTLATVTLILSCRKDFRSNENDYLTIAKQGLKDSLQAGDFATLDFDQAARSTVDSIGFYALYVPFKDKAPKEDFVFVKTDGGGKIEKGTIVHLVGKVSDEKGGGFERKRWDGAIELSSLDRKKVFQSPIVDGYVTAFHQQKNTRTASQEPQGELMPEVIIVYTRTSKVEMSWSQMYSLQGMFGGGGGGSSAGSGGGYYGSISGGGGSTGSSTNGSNSGSNSSGGSKDSSPRPGPSTSPVIRVDIETQDDNSPIDVKKFINCFNAVPDAGSKCSIEIFADIPVDKDPNKFFDFSTMSPGHTFICITKSNGTKYVTQNIGFYPKSGYKSMTYAPTTGKLVDNANHEFNASLSMNVTPSDFATILTTIQQLSNLNYNMEQYNCTDWALNVFNSVRTNKLQIPLYGLPSSPMTENTSTPQGLYNKLQQMKNSSNDPEKGNVIIGIVKGYAGGSTGPCN